MIHTGSIGEGVRTGDSWTNVLGFMGYIQQQLYLGNSIYRYIAYNLLSSGTKRQSNEWWDNKKAKLSKPTTDPGLHNVLCFLLSD